MQYFPIYQRNTIMHVHNILIPSTTSHDSANGSTPSLHLLVFLFHKICTHTSNSGNSPITNSKIVNDH